MHQRLRIGEPDVLARHAREAAEQIERFLARNEHPRQPIERRLRVRPAHRLVQRGDQIVVAVAITVVDRHAAVQELPDLARVERRLDGRGEQRLDLVEQKAAVAVGTRDQRGARLFGDGKAAPHLGLGARDQCRQRRLVEPVQHQHLRAAEQGGVEREAGIFGRRADEHHRAALDIGQETVLLGAVEAMDFIHEQQRPLARRRHLLGICKGFLEVGDAGEHRRQRCEAHPYRLGEQPRDRRLAGAGRSPEDDRRQLPRSNHPPDRALRARQMLLPDDIGQAAGAQPLGERNRAGSARVALLLRIVAEQVHGAQPRCRCFCRISRR